MPYRLSVDNCTKHRYIFVRRFGSLNLRIHVYCRIVPARWFGRLTDPQAGFCRLNKAPPLWIQCLCCESMAPKRPREESSDEEEEQEDGGWHAVIEDGESWQQVASGPINLAEETQKQEENHEAQHEEDESEWAWGEQKWITSTTIPASRTQSIPDGPIQVVSLSLSLQFSGTSLLGLELNVAVPPFVYLPLFGKLAIGRLGGDEPAYKEDLTDEHG